MATTPRPFPAPSYKPATKAARIYRLMELAFETDPRQTIATLASFGIRVTR